MLYDVDDWSMDLAELQLKLGWLSGLVGLGGLGDSGVWVVH